MSSLILPRRLQLAQRLSSEPDYFSVTPADGDICDIGFYWDYYMDSQVFEFRMNYGPWTSYQVLDPSEIDFITIHPGDICQFRGNSGCVTRSDLDYNIRFVATFPVSVSGNIMTLLKNDGKIDTVPQNCFFEFFDGWMPGRYERTGPHIWDISNLKLPAKTVESGAYAYMFYGCTNLGSAPIIHATSLGDYCCERMFSESSIKANSSQVGLTQYPYRVPYSGSVISQGQQPLVNMFGDGFYPLPEEPFYISVPVNQS